VDEARDLIARQDRSHVCRTEQPLRDRAGVDSQELIRSGAALDLQNKRGETRPHVRCKEHQPRQHIAQELIRSGAALDLQNKRGETALMYAARNTNHVNTSRRS
jgi:ankyrin repeat protein